MRRYNFEEYKSKIKENYFKNFSELESKKAISRRPRKEEDLAFLIEAAKWRFRNWIRIGKLKMDGERKYKLEI